MREPRNETALMMARRVSRLQQREPPCSAMARRPHRIDLRECEAAHEEDLNDF